MPITGALAQLVAHLLCKQGVRGSSPLRSTVSDVLEHLTSVEAGVGARAANGSASLIGALSSSLIFVFADLHAVGERQ